MLYNLSLHDIVNGFKCLRYQIKTFKPTKKKKLTVQLFLQKTGISSKSWVFHYGKNRNV